MDVNFPFPHVILGFDTSNDVLTRDIGVGLSGFGFHRFSPRYTCGGATFPRGKTVLSLSTYFQKINLRVRSRPNTLQNHRSMAPTICDPLGPINFSFPLYLSLSSSLSLLYTYLVSCYVLRLGIHMKKNYSDNKVGPLYSIVKAFH